MSNSKPFQDNELRVTDPRELPIPENKTPPPAERGQLKHIDLCVDPFLQILKDSGPMSHEDAAKSLIAKMEEIGQPFENPHRSHVYRVLDILVKNSNDMIEKKGSPFLSSQGEKLQLSSKGVQLLSKKERSSS